MLRLLLASCTSVAVVSADDWNCRTVATGNHYAQPPVVGTVDSHSRSISVRFDPNTVAYQCNCTDEPFPSCMASWNKLWGSSRCGYTHSHHQDSDRFVWRRHNSTSDLVEIAAYAYDSGVNPYNPPNKNLLQPFGSFLLPGVEYRLHMEIAAPTTTLVLYQGAAAGGAELERKVVEHANACSDFRKGYKLGLYFGGKCTGAANARAPAHACAALLLSPCWVNSVSNLDLLCSCHPLSSQRRPLSRSAPPIILLELCSGVPLTSGST